MPYTLKPALSSLTTAPKPFSLWQSQKFSKGELVIGAISAPDLSIIKAKTGILLPVAAGTCRRSEDGTVVLFKLTKSGGSSKSTITTLCKGNGETTVGFNEEAVKSTAPQGNDGQGGDGLPTQTPNDQNPPVNPGVNVNRPPLRRNQQIPLQRNQTPQPVRQRVAPPTRTATTMPPQSVTGAFPTTTMTSVKKLTDRGLLKGQGKFGKVFTGVESLGKIEAKLRGQNGQLDQQGKAKMVQAYDLMLNNVTGYMEGREGAPKDNVAKVKQEFCKKTETTLRLARAQVKYSDKYDRLNVLSQKPSLTEDESNEAEQTRAELLLRLNDEKDDQKPTSGSSDVRLIRNETGKVAYVFKSIDGESSQMNMAKGEGTAHEVLTSKLSDIFGTFGFNTGFPKTSMATLPLSEGKGQRGNKVGALVEGIPGEAPAEVGELRPRDQMLKLAGINFSRADLADQLRKQGVNEKKIDVQVDDTIFNATRTLTAEQKDQMAKAMNGRLALIGKTWGPNTSHDDMDLDLLELDKAEADALANQVSPTQMQQTLLTGLLSSSADIKWSNVMIDGQTARPFDGGGNMLSAQQLKDTQTTKSGKVDPLLGTSMLYLPSKTALHPGATQPLDPNLKAQVLNIDPNVVEQEMRTAVQKVQQTAPGLQNALGESNVQTSVASLICMQNAIQAAAPNATMEDIVTAFNLNMKAWMEGTDYPNAPAH